jgi:hypothetical protein
VQQIGHVTAVAACEAAEFLSSPCCMCSYLVHLQIFIFLVDFITSRCIAYRTLFLKSKLHNIVQEKEGKCCRTEVKCSGIRELCIGFMSRGLRSRLSFKWQVKYVFLGSVLSCKRPIVDTGPFDSQITFDFFLKWISEQPFCLLREVNESSRLQAFLVHVRYIS